MSDSVFADDLQIKGSVISKRDIKLNGVVEGDVSARKLLIEPPRVCRRLFRLSYAAMAGSSSMA